MNLIPQVKSLKLTGGFLNTKAVHPVTGDLDPRLLSALKKLPCDPEGTILEISLTGNSGEGYTLRIDADRITIEADGPAGAFYAIQTLRQIFQEKQVPCLLIHDRPDFSYRGFYHDATRGRIATVERVKALVDDMARFKMNSLQLYVEHVFEFRETEAITGSTGCYTRAELEEIGAYCRENFIDFVPSLSTFGHMHDILNQPQYRHLRVLSNYEPDPNRWSDRMAHHTIDPRNPESIGLVRSLIDQYAPCFESDWFNICCDETFDLKHCTDNPAETGRLYVDFVKQIVTHTQSLGKKVMMWADILLEHPETIGELPDDVMFLNWYYHKDAEQMERMISTLANLGCKQIVCPGTTTWNRFCEKYETEVPNILGMIRLGHKYGAEGVLNTNWGDWGNPCSLELGMFGMVLGAAASWNVTTENDKAFHSAVNTLLYGSSNGMEVLQRVSHIQNQIQWKSFIRCVFGEDTPWLEQEALLQIQEEYRKLTALLENQTWENDAYRQAFLLAAEAVCVVAERGTRDRLTDLECFLARYRQSWMRDNKESELNKLEDAFRWETTGIIPRWEK